MESVYIETTVIGNIAGRMHPDPRISVRQQITREWWSTAPERYRLVASQITVAECADGDAQAADERSKTLSGIELLNLTVEARELADALVAQYAVPSSQPRDSLHIAIAAVHGIEFIATWNFKHILNPHVQGTIEKVCRASGYSPPVICTPQQLLESDHDS